MNLDLYVRCFDSLMSRGPSRGPNNFFVYINHSKTWVKLLQRRTDLKGNIVFKCLVSRILEIFLQFCLHFLENFSSGLLIYSQG